MSHHFTAARRDSDADLFHPHLKVYVGTLYTGRRYPVTLSEALAANPFEPMVDDRGLGLL